MGAVPNPKMSVPPVVLVVAIVASILAAAASPCTAGGPPIAGGAEPKPLLENLPTSAAAQDFVRARCNASCHRRDEASRICYHLLLPYATSINGSYNRAAVAAVTVMVSKLTAFVKELGDYPEYKLDQCMQVVNEAISGAKETLAKLGRLDAMGDDKVDARNPDLNDAMNWIGGVHKNFQKCWDDDHKNFMDEHPVAAEADYSVYVADYVIAYPRPYWDSGLPSPDGA